MSRNFTENVTSQRFAGSVIRQLTLSFGFLLVHAASPCFAQLPAAANDAVERADGLKQVAINAFDRNDYPAALDNLSKCLQSLKQAESLASDPSHKAVLHDFASSERNRMILFCYTGVDNSNIRTGISSEWRTRIEGLAAPEALKDPAGFDGLVPLDWSVAAAYAGVQQHLADYYIRKKDWSRANWHFATAETYFEQYDRDAPRNVLADPEAKRWRDLNKRRLSDLLSTRGITEGMYVQNSGVLQKWIGRVVSVEGGTIKVRITYKSSAAPRGFEEGEDISLLRSEIKGVESLSIDAIRRGYK